jgi:hypothetical protein
MNNDILKTFIKPVSVINSLREKYGGEWVYRGNVFWEHIGKGFVTAHSEVDEFENPVGMTSYYYHHNDDKKPIERIFL